MSCNCSMQIQHLHVLAHARPTMSCIPLVIYAAQFFPYQECNWGEPERAPHRRVCCEFSIYLFLYIYRTSCRKSLPARILRVIASCVNSNHKRTHHCNVKDCDTNHERSTSTRMETIARGEGLKHFIKTGRVLQAISCPACRAHHGAAYI